ncbi:MAG: acyl-CoA dehydrogenase C-terminal domain-containing protein, partial [Hyphomicrobiales bacterium]|nr:acyl-CoA dehydrogenase C-terminal domain-containing protein [Hyphomicrobiales bacterium]
QALDLVGRKLPMHMGRLLRRFFHPVDRFIAEHKDAAALQEFVLPLAKALGKLQQATVLIAQRGLKNPDEAAAAASDYLRLFGLTASAFMWARMAKISLAKSAGDEAWFYKGKLATARFFMSRLLPETSSLLTIISAGAKPIMELEAEAF